MEPARARCAKGLPAVQKPQLEQTKESEAQEMNNPDLSTVAARQKQPFYVRVNLDSVEIRCPCGAGFVGEGEPVAQFKAEHFHHTNGKTTETITPDGLRGVSVAAGQVRDEMKKRIEVLIHQPPELTVRLRIAETCEWLRNGAAGRALEVLEELMAEFERNDRDAQVAAWEGAVKARAHEMGHLPCGCPRAMESLCPHGNSNLA